MNNNKSKQLLASIIGIAVLVVAVAGVSFAFFTYSRTGSGNNIITAGKISFTFADNSYIKITNHFPIATSAGVVLSGTNNTCTFTVTGNTTSGSSINYAVWAVPGDLSSAVDDINATQFTTKFADSEVFVNIQTTGTVPSGATFSPAMTSSQGKAISTLATSASNAGTRPTNGRLLGTGAISGSGTDKTINFIVRMWVDESVVTICDSGCTYTATNYEHLYYTMKIAVTAQQ